MSATRRGTQRRALLVAVGLTVTGVALAGTAMAVSGTTSQPSGEVATSGGEATADTSTLGTAVVTRQDLVRTETLTGTLSFGGSREVSVHTDGVVTVVSQQGGRIDIGAVAYAVDNEPTLLLEGSIPAYRELSEDATDGGDITQLEQALVDFGFGSDVSVDGDFDSATGDAVQAWEESLGRSDPDATVALGDVLFATGPVQVAEVLAPIGAQVGSGDGVIAATSTVKQVDLDVSVDRADDIAVATAVTIDLPDGSTTTGLVADVGTTPESNASGAGAEETVPVVVSLDATDAAACCTTGSVDVTIERSRDPGVLVVPVAALLALAEGGYAVEVVDPGAAGGARLVAVDPGSFADDLVAITGLDEGTEVVVAS